MYHIRIVKVCSVSSLIKFLKQTSNNNHPHTIMDGNFSLWLCIKNTAVSYTMYHNKLLVIQKSNDIIKTPYTQ